jgi:hypothetical protein
MLSLLPWSSCNSMPKDSVHVESETTFESIKGGKSVRPVIRYYMTDGKTEYGTALMAFINNDTTIYEILLTGNNLPEQHKGLNDNNMKKGSLLPMDNESQLFMIDQVLGKIEQSYHLASIHRIRLLTQYLGDFSVRLLEGYKKCKDFRIAIRNDIFYKKLSSILVRHGLSVSFISLEDVYWNKVKYIDPYCIISNKNQKKLYADAMIFLEFGKTGD